MCVCVCGLELSSVTFLDTFILLKPFFNAFILVKSETFSLKDTGWSFIGELIDSLPQRCSKIFILKVMTFQSKVPCRVFMCSSSKTLLLLFILLLLSECSVFFFFSGFNALRTHVDS